MPLGSFRLNTFATLDAAPAGRTAVTVTASGNAQVSTAQSKFGGASALFDGTSDWLSFTNSGSFAFGTSDFTVEAWCRFANTNVDMSIFGGAVQTASFDFRRTNDNLLRVGRTNTDWNAISNSTGIVANTWYHIAVSRSGTTMRIFVNGTQVYSGSNTISYVMSSTAYIGGRPNETYFNGYIDELRISNTARYTSAFTPSATSFINDTNTLLLLHMNGTNASTFFDDDNGTGRSRKGISAIGNAQIDTAQSQFGGASALFDGTGDYLVVNPYTTEFAFSSNFTIELWARPANVTGIKIMYDARNAGGYSENSPVIYQDGSTFKFYFAADRAISGTISANTWYHLAVVKSGSDYKFYVNGTQVGSTYTNSATVTASSVLWLGAHKANGANTGYDYNGWMDEIRVSSVARYSANFTPSTTAFTNDSDTLLLVHANGTDATTIFTDDNSV